MTHRSLIAPLAGAVLAVVALAAGCGGGDGAGASAESSTVAATDARIGGGEHSAALYVDLAARGGDDAAPEALVGASCTCAGRVVLHEAADMGADVAMMLPTERIEIPNDGELELRPGGSHVMLEDLREPLEEGDTVEVELRFEPGDPLRIEVPVVPLASLVETTTTTTVPEAG